MSHKTIDRPAGRTAAAKHAGGGWNSAAAARAVPHLVLLAVALWLPFALSAGQLHLAVSVLIAAVGAIGLDVLTGRTGQVSLGHAFFLGVGALVGAKPRSTPGTASTIPRSAHSCSPPWRTTRR